MLRDLKNKGFASITEVIITVIVFVIASAGILSTVAMFRPQGAETSEKIEAAYIGKGIIDQLRQQVNPDNWTNATGNLAVGIHNLPPVGMYNVTYNVTEPSPNVRRVTIDVDW